MITDIKAWLDESALMDAKPVPHSAGLSIPIEKCEELLDELTELNWSTTNYHSVLYQNENGEMCCYASIEVDIDLTLFNNMGFSKTLTGACNFKLSDHKDNPHWNATAKSLCVVNALTDLGRRTGRWLNYSLNNDVPSLAQQPLTKVKLKPDHNIIKEHLNAIVMKDFKRAEKLEQIYDLKIGE